MEAQGSSSNSSGLFNNTSNDSSLGPDMQSTPTNIIQSASDRVALSGPIRVPGTYPPEWLPDQEAEACMTCESTFTIIKRRHHCRSCGKIFCGDCCRLKAKLLYLDNKEARVCNNCHRLIEFTLTNSEIVNNSSDISISSQRNDNTSPSLPVSAQVQANSTQTRVQGVLKTSSHTPRANSSGGPSDQTSTSALAAADHQHTNKQVIFSDGIRPGTDLTEQQADPQPIPSSSSSLDPTSSSSVLDPENQAPAPLITRQHRESTDEQPGSLPTRRSKNKNSESSSIRNITVCDEIGYLPPIVISNDSPIAKSSADNGASSSSSQFANLILNQFKTTLGKKTIQASMESRNCPLNGIVNFENISELVGVNNVVTFLLLKGFYLKVKVTRKDCCIEQKFSEDDIVLDRLGSGAGNEISMSNPRTTNTVAEQTTSRPRPLQFWCFTSSGLNRFGQDEVMLVINKDPNDPCIPRDIFKIFLTLHELALRRQTLENLGNLLFQDGLFDSRDTAGLVFVRPLAEHCLKNLIIPESKNFLVALVLQRWEVPWSKVFPMRLLLRLGYKYEVYPYPIVSFRTREPVYYEVGHTIISILGDFRNFRYSITHVDGLKVMIDKAARKVTVQLNQTNYQQFNKVLDSSNNEHVLAWSCCPFSQADGHLVSVQTDDGQYETVEFLKSCPSRGSGEKVVDFKDLDSSSSSASSGPILGASFIIFSGALKVNQSGQPAKISIVEDGLLVQIQSCSMTALKSSIHFMHHFDIDCETTEDTLNKLEILWLPEDDDN